MKKLAIAMMLGVSALTASAQVNYKVQTACHPQDVKHYDTERLRNSFMMEKVMAPMKSMSLIRFMTASSTEVPCQ